MCLENATVGAQTPATPPLSRLRRNLLLAEMLLIFFALPAVLILIRTHLRHLVPLLILGGGLLIGIVLSLQRDFDQRTALSVSRLARNLPRVLLAFLPPALLLTAVVYLFNREEFFALPCLETKFWMILMVLYPTLGATLQELFFRAFFFHRYERLFPDSWVFLLINAVSFALFHLFYLNWVAPPLSFAGGLLFAWRYRQTRSLLTVAFEHGLWGNYIFTVGIGYFFWSGGIQ
jgi:membrane protease YdiL (CAAX protease family)